MQRAIIIAVILLIIATTAGLASIPKRDGYFKLHYSDLTSEAKTQVDCLAENIYREAGHEPAQGKQAVAFVTLNRTVDERYPSDICSVVKQKTKRTCQFSWFCLPMKAIDKTSEEYKESLSAALHIYANYEKLQDFTEGALFYHADYVNPRWRGLTKTVTIGRHIFYKEVTTYDAKTKPTII
jgi:spore germination cell wall hydrolase CwlJ-like protein